MTFKPKTYTKIINNKEYTAQFNGLAACLEAFDNFKENNGGSVSISKMAKYLFKNVIVSPPNLSADDFENLSELNEVLAFGGEVMQGNFRQEE